MVFYRTVRLGECGKTAGLGWWARGLDVSLATLSIGFILI